MRSVTFSENTILLPLLSPDPLLLLAVGYVEVSCDWWRARKSLFVISGERVELSSDWWKVKREGSCAPRGSNDRCADK